MAQYLVAWCLHCSSSFTAVALEAILPKEEAYLDFCVSYFPGTDLALEKRKARTRTSFLVVPLPQVLFFLLFFQVYLFVQGFGVGFGRKRNGWYLLYSYFTNIPYFEGLDFLVMDAQLTLAILVCFSKYNSYGYCQNTELLLVRKHLLIFRFMNYIVFFTLFIEV